MCEFFKYILLVICLVTAACIESQGTKKPSKENTLLEKKITSMERELDSLKNVGKPSVGIPELYKEVKKGVFIIYAKGQDGISQGTGFFLNENGTAISNYHIFENADSAIVILDDKSLHLINKIYEYDKVNDFVVFQVDNLVSSCHALSIADDNSEIGATCFAIGNPRGYTQTLTIGNISSYREEGQLIQTTAEITFGSSGGPLFNDRGQVIGITTSGVGDANINFAINIDKIPYSKYVGGSQVHSGITGENSKSFMNLSDEEIASIINEYYSSFFDRDYSRLSSLYAPILDRFYNDFNVPSTVAVHKAQSYWSIFNIGSAQYDINWNTLSILKLREKNDYQVRFNMNYQIVKNNGKHQSYRLIIVMTINSSGKIRSIYEYIV